MESRGLGTHVWVEEIESPQIYDAWLKTLDLIDALHPAKVIPGHIESGWELDAQTDLAHNRKYLVCFPSRVNVLDSHG
jgi:hypothetical protein